MFAIRGLISSNASSFRSLVSFGTTWFGRSVAYQSGRGQYSTKTPEELLKGLEKASERAYKIIKDLSESKIDVKDIGSVMEYASRKDLTNMLDKGLTPESFKEATGKDFEKHLIEIWDYSCDTDNCRGEHAMREAFFLIQKAYDLGFIQKDNFQRNFRGFPKRTDYR